MKSIYILLLTCLLLSVTANRNYPDPLITAYACEHHELYIGCDEDKVMHLIRANYGRLGLIICGDLEQDFNINCFSYKSFLIMQQRCSGKQTCNVRASNHIFGDPCPGTVKYLEVRYQCISPYSDSLYPGQSGSIPTTAGTTTVISKLPNHCPPIIMNEIQWNWTKAGTQAIRRCPPGAIGFASWHCGSDPVEWVPSEPDLRECKSDWVASLQEKAESGESVNSVATELAVMTEVKPVYAKDLKAILDILQQTLSRAIDEMEKFHDLRHGLRHLLESLLETISNLLKRGHSAWRDLSTTDRHRIIGSLFNSLEESVLSLAQSSGKDIFLTLAEDNVLLSVKVLNERTTLPMQFPMPDDFRDETRATAWIRMDDSLVLPAQTLLDASKEGPIKVVFVVYSGVEEIMQPEKDFGHRNGKENSTWMVNSKVIAASFGKPKITTLSQPAIITFRHLKEENMTNPICVYWDSNTSEWSVDGCLVQASNKSHTVCACSHLSNFAVIMELANAKEVPLPQEVSQVTTAVGFGIFIVCIVLILIPVFLFRKKIIEIAQKIINK